MGRISLNQDKYFYLILSDGINEALKNNKEEYHESKLVISLSENKFSNATDLVNLNTLSFGIYIYKIQADDFIQSKKMILLK